MFSHNCVATRNYITAKNNFMITGFERLCLQFKMNKHFIKTRIISQITHAGTFEINQILRAAKSRVKNMDQSFHIFKIFLMDEYFDINKSNPSTAGVHSH